MSDATYFTGAGQPSFATETRTGKWTREFAFAALEPTATIFRAPHEQFDNAYTQPNVSNLANYNIGNVTAYFCQDVQFRDKGANISTWTRELRTLPANYNFYETYSYTFPGYYNGTIERAVRTDAPTSRVQCDFFLIGNTSYGASYASPQNIPRFAAQTQNFAWAYVLDYATTGNVVTNVGAFTVIDGYLANTNANIYVFASNPNLATWKSWVANGTEVEVEPSAIEWYSGPIWMRKRRFVTAQ